jgi:hypothetical protein
MSRFSPFDYGLSGPDLSAKVRQLAETVDQLAEFLPYLPALVKSVKEPKDPGINVFLAVITGYKAADQAYQNQWLYSWVEYTPDSEYPASAHPDFAPGLRNSSSGTADTFTLHARNGLERGNAGQESSIDGVGVKVGDILADDGTTVLATSQFLPIGRGTVDNLGGPALCQRMQTVIMMELAVPIYGCKYWFTASNAILVECA